MTLSAYPTTSAISSPGRQNLPQSSCFSTTTVTKPGGSVQLLSKTRWLCSFQIIQVIRSTMESKPLRRSPGMHILLMSHQTTKWYTSGTFMVESKLNQILRMIWVTSPPFQIAYCDFFESRPSPFPLTCNINTTGTKFNGYQVYQKLEQRRRQESRNSLSLPPY